MIKIHAAAGVIESHVQSVRMSYPAYGRGGWRGGGRGGYGGAPQVFQAKKWVKPGTEGAVKPAAAQVAEAAATQGEEWEGGLDGGGDCGCTSPHMAEGVHPDASAGGVAVARKWVKGQGVTGPPPPAPRPAPPARPPPPDRGRLSVFVGNLDPSVSEDNLWRFFGQAGRVNSVKVMPRKEGKPFVIAFVNYADGTLLDKCREMLKVLDDTAPSWNCGVKISVAERGEDGTKAKPMKERETEEQRSERLEKLREEFPWLPYPNPAEMVKKWTQREAKNGQKLSQQQQMELLGFGGDDAGAESDSDSDDGGGGSKRRRKRVGGDGGESDEEREGKRLRGPGEEGDDGEGMQGMVGPEGDGGDALKDMDAEDRIVHERFYLYLYLSL